MIEPLDIQDLLAAAAGSTAPVPDEQLAEAVGRLDFINGALMQYCHLLAVQVNELEARLDQRGS